MPYPFVIVVHVLQMMTPDSRESICQVCKMTDFSQGAFGRHHCKACGKVCKINPIATLATKCAFVFFSQYVDVVLQGQDTFKTVTYLIEYVIFVTMDVKSQVKLIITNLAYLKSFNVHEDGAIMHSAA